MNKDLIMYISYLCYELYKIDWKYSHGITKEKEMNSIKGYYRSINNIHDMDYNTYDEYLEEFGYDGELYVSYEEFWDNEYRNIEYMSSLLNDDKLISMYLSTIEI